MPEMTEITDAEKDMFRLLHAAFEHGSHEDRDAGLAVVPSELDGKRVAVLVWVDKEETGKGEAFSMTPLAVLVNEELMDHLTPPGEAVRAKGAVRVKGEPE